MLTEMSAHPNAGFALSPLTPFSATPRSLLPKMLLDPIQARAQFADALACGYAILAVNADSPAALTDCLKPRAGSGADHHRDEPGNSRPQLRRGRRRARAHYAILSSSARHKRRPYREVPVIFTPTTQGTGDAASSAQPFAVNAGRLRDVVTRLCARSR